jgi:predicted outer membrane protein
MTRVFSRSSAVLTLLVLLAIDSVSTAQVIRRPFRREAVQPVQPGQPAAGVASAQSNSDTFLASWLGLDNQDEISLSRLAVQQTSQQDVKGFAQQMIKDHTDLASHIQQTLSSESAAASNSTSPAQQRMTGYRGPEATPQAPQTQPGTTPGQPADPNAARTSAQQQAPQQPAAQQPPPAVQQQQPTVQQQPAVQQQQPTAQQQNYAQQPGAPMAGSSRTFGVDPLQFKSEIARQCLAMAEQELRGKQGTDFDMCYIGSQISGHVHMIASLTVAKNYASPQLRPVLEQAIGTAQHHLDEAKSIMKRLDQASRSQHSGKAT